MGFFLPCILNWIRGRFFLLWFFLPLPWENVFFLPYIKDWKREHFLPCFFRIFFKLSYPESRVFASLSDLQPVLFAYMPVAFGRITTQKGSRGTELKSDTI